MLGSDAPLLVGGLVLVGFVVLAIGVASWAAWRATRRRWRALRGHPAVRGAVALWSLARTAPLTAALSGSGRPGGHSSAVVRRRLWLAVGAADRAVRGAGDAGGSVGELPSLVRRLHGVAADLDRVLRMGPGLGSGSADLDEASHQAAAVVDAAARIRSAAIAAAGDAARTRVAALAGDADRELRSLTAGLARARSVLPTRPGT